VVNDGERAYYTINSGSASNYKLLIGTDYKGFPSSIVNFEAGRIYNFDFNDNISLVSNTELKLENVDGITVPQQPAVPVVITSSTFLTLQWTAVESATAYEIWMSTTNNSALASKYGTDVTGTLSATISDLVNETTYYIWLKAKNNFGASSFSPVVVGIPSASTVKPPDPQIAPTVIAGNRQLTVNWQAVEGASVYEIWAGTANNIQIATKRGEDVSGYSAVISSLNNGTTYYVWIKAKNTIGVSGFSPSASGKPLGTPGMPTLNSGPWQLLVTWTAVAGADEYEVYYGTSTPTMLAVTTAGTTATITGLTNGTTYYVRLRAKNVNGVSDYGSNANGVPDCSPGLFRGIEKIGNQNLATALSWISTNAVSGNNFIVVLGANESISPTSLSYSGKTVGITLMGYSSERIITLNANGSMFTINSGVTFTLDENITLVGRDENTASVVYVSNGGKLILNYGAKISGNTNTNANIYGSGVSVYYGGILTMNGGEISNNNHSNGGGGGVDVANGTFTMSGGKIRGNTANNGGGVYVDSNGLFTMNGGTISGNTSKSNGGGVFVYVGTFKKIPPNGGQNSGIIFGSEAVGVDEDGISLKNTGNGAAVNSFSSPSSSKSRNNTVGQTDQIDTTTGKGL